jgi:hypothetical protein
VKPGAALAALRRRSWHNCAVCKKRFSGIAKAVYCSNACKQKAKNQRNAARRGDIEHSEGKP